MRLCAPAFFQSTKKYLGVLTTKSFIMAKKMNGEMWKRKSDYLVLIEKNTDDFFYEKKHFPNVQIFTQDK